LEPTTWIIIVIAVLGGVAYYVTRSEPPDTPRFALPRSTGGDRVQLRRDDNGCFVYGQGFAGRKVLYFIGTGCPPARLGVDLDTINAQQVRTPVPLARLDAKAWWLFEGTYYWENGQYSDRDVLALVRDRERRERTRLERAHMLLNAEQRSHPGRLPIPREVKRMVFERDGGQCVSCGAAFDLQYDHVIPVALGGASSTENLQLLCGTCNRQKGASI